MFREPDWDTHRLTSPAKSIARGNANTNSNASQNQQQHVTLNKAQALIQRIDAGTCRPNSNNAEYDL